jgi:hypothetical protein
VLLDDDGDDGDLPTDLDRLNELEPDKLSSRQRWRWLWGDQDRYDVRGAHYSDVFEHLVSEYRDRHGLPRLPLDQSGRSSNGRARTGYGSRGKRR